MKRLILLFVLLIYGILPAQNGWIWQNPLPRGNSYYDVTYTPGGIGWIVGEKGIVLKSTDGGLSWIEKRNNLSQDIVSICFPNEQTGYMASSDGILKSTDGGETWNLTGITGYYPNMYFVNADTGFLTGIISLIKTTNGGISWETVFENDGYTHFHGIHFYGNIGMVVGGWNDFPGSILYKTTDGGITWNKKNFDTGDDGSDVFLIDEMNAVCTAGGIYRTSDGGDTWIKVYGNDKHLPRYSTITFCNKTFGFIASGGILKTTDGGWSWLLTDPNNQVYSISYKDSSKINAVGSTGRIYQTTNGGLNWFKQYTSIIEKSLTSVNFINEDYGFIVGYEGTLMRTTDGGKAWEKINFSNYVEYTDVSFIDRNNGIIMSRGNLFKTTNGGDSWINLNTPQNFYPILMHYINFNTVVALGDYGCKVIKTTNGGITWEELNNNISNQFRGTSISFSGELHGIVAGFTPDYTNSVISSTSNGGLTWNSSYFQNMGPVSISFPDSLNAFAVGGLILKSSNGGKTWIQLSNPDNQGWIDVSCVDGQNAFLVGRGIMMTTTNGGINWNYQNLIKMIDLKSVYAINKNNAIAVGDDGVIIKYSGVENLPVELSSFAAIQNKNNVLLNWQTATETNNKGFEVQRKVTLGEYISLGFIQGNGTTTTTLNYSYSDANVSSGIYTYRLKQINFDGSFEYSKEIEINVNEIPREFSLEQNYPNPFNPITTIKFSVPKEQLVEIKIYDVLGNEVARVVRENFSPGSYEHEWDASKLSSGVYYLSMKAGEFSSTKKMILMK